MTKLDIIDAKIIKGTLNGKTAAELGAELYPQQKPESARVSVAKRLQKVTVKDSLQAALLKHNLTLDKALKPIADALKATKLDRQVVGRDERGPVYEWVDSGIPDHTTRLKAADRVISLLGLEKRQAEPEQMSAADVKALATTSDEVELQKIVFRSN